MIESLHQEFAYRSHCLKNDFEAISGRIATHAGEHRGKVRQSAVQNLPMKCPEQSQRHGIMNGLGARAVQQLMGQPGPLVVDCKVPEKSRVQGRAESLALVSLAKNGLGNRIRLDVPNVGPGLARLRGNMVG